MIILSLPGSPGIERNLAEQLGAELVTVESKVFPDGETYIRLPRDVSGSPVVIVQSLYPDQDRRLVELLLAVDTCKDMGASRIVAVVPYMAYARQDRRFRDGEPISIKLVLKMLGYVGATHLLTVDMHKSESLNYFPGKFLELTVLPTICAEVLPELKEPLVLAPDLGALKRARIVAEKFKLQYDYLEKFRDRVTGEVTMKPKQFDVGGRDVIIVDDIISTGGTIAKATKILKSMGARKVYVAVAHALMVGNAYERIIESGVDLVLTANTIRREVVQPKVKVVDISTEISSGVRKLLQG